MAGAKNLNIGVCGSHPKDVKDEAPMRGAKRSAVSLEVREWLIWCLLSTGKISGVNDGSAEKKMDWTVLWA